MRIRIPSLSCLVLGLIAAGCVEPVPDGGALAVRRQAAVAATSILIDSPTTRQVISVASLPAAVTVRYRIAGAPPVGLATYVDDTYDGAETDLDGTYTFAAVPLGEHRLTLAAVDAAGVRVPGVEAGVIVRVAPPCTGEADCADGNACSADRCIGNQCRWGASGIPDCCHSAFDCPLGPGGFRACIDNGCVECVTTADCDDGDACTVEQCVAGTCVVAPIRDCCTVDRDCDDRDPCTPDRCVASRCESGPPAAGCCTEETAPTRCADGNPCTADFCIGGVCRHAQPVAGCCRDDAGCDDGSPCTLDKCDPLLHVCLHVRDPEASVTCCDVHWDCDDGDPATLDSCEGGTCVSVADGLYCDASTPCPPPEVPACMLSQCVRNRCMYVTSQGCCTKKEDCDDYNPCTTNECRNNACVFTPIPRCCGNDADCADANPCNLDACVRGVCRYGPNPKATGCCTADAQCTGGTSCAPGRCLANYRCGYPVDSGISGCGCTTDAACDDRDPCTTDRCSNGSCVYSSSGLCECANNSDCDDGRVCTVDFCVGQRCYNEVRANCCETDADCEDGNGCTINTCDPVTHLCRLTVPKKPGCCLSDPSCADNDPATRDSCIDFRCHNILKPNYCKRTAECTDLDPCTGDLCLHGVCRRFHRGNAPPVVYIPSACCADDAQCGGSVLHPCQSGGCQDGVCRAASASSVTVQVPYVQVFDAFAPQPVDWDIDCWSVADAGPPAAAGWGADGRAPLGPDRHLTFVPPVTGLAFDTCAVSPSIDAARSNYLTVAFEYAAVGVGQDGVTVRLGALDGAAALPGGELDLQLVPSDRRRLVTVGLPPDVMQSRELGFSICVAGAPGAALESLQIDDFRIAATRPPEFEQVPEAARVVAGEALAEVLSARDPDAGATLTYTLVEAPDFVVLGGATVDPFDGSYDVVLSGVPADGDIGEHLVRVQVFDGRVSTEAVFVVVVVARTCGNGLPDPGEECDDGSANSDTAPDACRLDCTAPRCGDGVTDPGRNEACDDGSRNADTGGCTSACAVARCGDGFVRASVEECDDRNNEDGDGCSATCRLEATVTCGNGQPDPGEECDDGAANSDTAPDACRTNCRLARCGDGTTDTGEQCDAAAANSDSRPDACRMDCRRARCGDGTTDTGEQCDAGGANSDSQPDACRTDCRRARCGDRVVDSGEQCDDGGTADGDGCSSLCRTEASVPCGNGLPDPGEECDDGPANSDVRPDACRTDCTAARCGDEVVDSGEQCDDGNPIDGDGCSRLCRTELVSRPVPYEETFDDATTLSAVHWAYEGAPGSTVGFVLSRAGALGPDRHPRTIFLGSSGPFEDRLLSPLIDARAFASATVSWDNRLDVESVVAGSFAIELRVSRDAGATWTTVWTHEAAAGALPAGPLHVDVTSALAGAQYGRIAFVIHGSGESDWIAWDIDTVRIRSGRPPRFTAPPADQDLVAGATAAVVVSAADPDTAGNALTFGLSNAPPFASVQPSGGGNATVLLAPSADVTGTWRDVVVTVSDGTYTASARFSVTVRAPDDTGRGRVARVLVRDAAGGAGAVVGDVDAGLGGHLNFYAAGYDALGTYVQDVAVLWRSTGTLEPVVAGPATSVTLALPNAGRQGRVLATPLDSSIVGDQTGVIRVLAPPPGPVSLTRSTLSVARSALVANGLDSTTVTVRLVDANGTPVTAPHAVALTTTAGLLTGSVVAAGDGRYTQTLVSAAAPATATVRATVNGVLLPDSRTVRFTTYEQLAGGLVIDCTNLATYANKNLVVDGVTVTLNATPDCAPMSFGDLIVRNGGTLTHSAATTAVVYTIDVRVTSLYVDATSRIDVTGKGYAIGRTFGNGTVGGPTVTRAGGSHGGLGGQGGGVTYDDYRDPRLPGGGSNYKSGGGVVRVDVSGAQGAAVIDGAITAEGVTDTRGSSAGGAVRIRAALISGSGSISVDGGAAYHSDFSTHGGGGGGGRVALVGFDTLSGSFAPDVLSVFARGGDVSRTNATAEGLRGGAGTIYLESRAQGTAGDLVVDNGGRKTSYDSTPLLGFSGTSEVVAGSDLTDHEAQWFAGLYAGMLVNPDTGQGATLSLADDSLLRVETNTDKTLNVAGSLAGFAPGRPYRAAYVFQRLEIRGLARVSADADILVLDGDLHSERAGVFELRGGLRGARVFELATPVGELRVTNGGLAVGDLVVGGDPAARIDWSLSGSAVEKSVLVGRSLLAASSTVTVGTLDVTADALLDGTAVLTVQADTVRVGERLLVRGSAILTHPAATADRVYTLDVAAHAVEVAGGARIDVSGRGYAAGRTVGNAAGGPVVGAGGSHGGRGGSDSETAPPVYGDLRDPRLPGSGARNVAGGGVVRVVATESVVVDGAIRASGTSNDYGGSAGGSISIRTARIGGTGTIEADGGVGSYQSFDRGCGGGGGRIALRGFQLASGRFAYPTPWEGLRARGGDVQMTNVSYAPRQGGAGTIFLEPAGATWGDLVVDNRDVRTAGDSTPLVDLGSGTVQSVTATVLRADRSLWVPGALAGYLVNPNVAQGDPDTLTDDAFFRVTGNDAAALTLTPANGSQPLTAVSGAGRTYRSVYVFDNLQVRGRARLGTTGDILVLSGDVQSGDATTLRAEGVIRANRLEVAAVDHLAFSNDGGLLAGEVVGAGDPNRAFRYTFDGAALEEPVVRATSFDFANGAAVIGTLLVSGDARLAGTAAVTIAADQVTVGGQLTLEGSAVLSHAASTATTERDLVVRAASVSIGPGARIDVTGRGYPVGRTFGNTTTGGALRTCGGSHGGLGGLDGCTPPRAYGSLFVPRTLGGGGAEAAGGGRVALFVTGRLSVDGAIRANGAAEDQGSGAGGSIYIEADRVQGAGVVEASGGQGDYDTFKRGGGGGGGRVAVVGFTALDGAFAYPTPYLGLQARGGDSQRNTWTYRLLQGGAGTIYLRARGALRGDLVVDNGGVLTDGLTTPLVDVGAGAWTEVEATTLFTDRVDLPDGQYVGTWVNPNVGQGDPTTLLDDVLYRVAANQDGDIVPELPDGTPAPPAVTAARTSYRAIHVFDNLEVRGYARLRTAGDLLVLDGDLHSGDTTTFEAGGFIDAHTLELRAVDTIVTLPYGGLDLERLVSAGIVGFPFDWTSTGGALDLRAVAATNMTLTDVAAAFDTVAVADQLRLAGATTLTIRDSQVQARAVRLTGTAVLDHAAATAARETDLVVTAELVDVGAGTRIDVTGRGYPAGRTWRNTTVGAASGRSGGSHGGLGGLYAGTPPAVYGDLYRPRTLGAGSAYAAGGGRVFITATGRVSVDGTIRANGAGDKDGAGAGGSVFLETPRLEGAGRIEADGGTGSFLSFDTGCGGGGGRVAIVGFTSLGGAFAYPNPHLALSARGGGVQRDTVLSQAERNGGAGTVYLRGAAATWGDLIVDNGDRFTTGASTPFVEPGPGTISALGAATLTDDGAVWLPDRFVGVRVNPAGSQGSAATLTDDVLYRVTGNSADVLTFAAGGAPLGAVTAVGETYRPIWVFDNLELRGKARLATGGDLLVLGGDLRSNDATTFAAGGWLKARRLEFSAVGSLTFTNSGGLEVDAVASGGALDPRFAWSLTDSTLATNAVNATSLALTAVTADVGRVTASADAVLDGATVLTVRDALLDVAGRLELRGTAVVTHPAATADRAYDLEIQANRLEIAAGAAIDVSGRGYPAGRTVGNTTVGASSGRCGGSHGGRGGLYDGTPAAAYGDLRLPRLPGSGGAFGAGGGRVWLRIATAAIVDGAIRADGVTNDKGAGAGGAVLLEVGTLAGTGVVAANGGVGDNSGFSHGGGGGGGRIAVRGFQALGGAFAYPSPHVGLRATGGMARNNSATYKVRQGGAGTVFLLAAGGIWGDLLVDNGGLLTEGGSTPLVGPGEGEWTAVAAASGTDGLADWPADRYQGAFVDPNVAQGDPVTLRDDVLYRISGNTDDRLDLDTAGGPFVTAVAAVGDTYRGVHVFDNLEVRGLARVWAEGDLYVRRGDLSSSDDTTFAADGLVAAHRLEFDQVDRVVIGNGGLSAVQLVSNGVETWPIRFVFTNAAIEAGDLRVHSLDVTGGTLVAGALTAVGDVRFAGTAAAAVATADIAGALVLDGDAVLTITNTALDVGGDLTLAGNARLTHAPATTTRAPTLEIDAQNVLVGATAAIDVTGKGYPVAVTGFLDSTRGPAARGGGSHGGQGGLRNAADPRAPVYDDLYAPALPGGGGAAGTSPGAPGGGVIVVRAAQALTVHGLLTADGGAGNYGGGAGGTIRIEAARLTGTGTIRANGGAGHYSYGGAGGGGRIAIIGYETLDGSFALPTALTRILARGGDVSSTSASYDHMRGGAGTVHLRSAGQTWGDLIIDNGDLVTKAGTTPLIDVGAGPVTALTATRLTDAAAAWWPGRHVGGLLLPRYPQGSATTLGDDVSFPIVANTATVLTVDPGGGPDLLAVTAVGASFRSFFAFDNLEVRGRARVSTAANLLVLSGDLASGNATHFAVPVGAELVCHVLDVGSIPCANVTGTITATRFCQ
jgi:cysteine-rich repeat protein